MKQQQPREAAPLWVLLALGALAVGTIAYLTGYSEPAALVRAFKRWTGTTPMKYREAVL